MNLERTAAFGVAGNFTGHLEQAGEAADFREVRAKAGRPKGMFPCYLPAGLERLQTWPFDDSQLVLPPGEADVQPEPELALRCRVFYDQGGVCGLLPEAFAACDDTSIRRPPQPKISLKKNWGPRSKGLGPWMALDSFDDQGVLQHFRLACYLVRDGETIPYGEDSPVSGYSTVYDTLITWMVDRLRNQTDEGPLEPIGAMLDAAGRPETAIISIGATRYTAAGAQMYVKPGDDIAIVAYDGRISTADAVQRAVSRGTGALIQGASVLRRTVVSAP